MYRNNYSEQMISITVQILKRQDLKTIQTLKDVLTYLPSPSYSRQILTTAIAQLSETSPEAICWLLQNSDCLQPEFNAADIIILRLSSKLSSWGFVRNRDFYFTDNGQLITSQFTRKVLLSDSTSISSTAGDVTALSIIRALLSTESINDSEFA